MNASAPGDGTVGKALEVLDLVAEFDRPVRFGELQKVSRFPKATLYRLVQTLAAQGMLRYDSDRQTYTPGLRLVQLAHSAWRNASLAPIARPHVDALAEEVGEAVHVAQLDHGQVLFVDKRRATNMFETLARTGLVAPAYCTGVGKVILAHMDEPALSQALKEQAFLPYTPNSHVSPDTLMPELAQIRADGFGFDREEHEVGIISIAAPILARSGRPLGAISIATLRSRRSLDDLVELRPKLTETTSRIAADLETWRFPA